MSCLKIYFQFGYGFEKKLQDFKMKCRHSQFDIICITCSNTNGSISDEEFIDTNIFDIFRLDAQHNEEKNIHTYGTFIAARKHLSAYFRREWMIAGVDCVWITVPSRGCRSRLHIACVNFYLYTNIDPFAETLLSLSKNHPSDKSLVLGRFPPHRCEDYTSKKQRKTNKPQSSTTGKSGNEVIQKIHSTASLVGLGQFNNMMIQNKSHLVFSSVPVSVTYSNPLVPWSNVPLGVMDYNLWFKTSLKFDLNIGPPQCCKTPNDASGNALNGQCEALRKDAVASGDVSNITDELVEKTCNKVIKLLPELIEFKDNSKAIANIEKRLKTFEDNSKKISNIDLRLQTFEDSSKTCAKTEENLKLFEDVNKKITDIDKKFEDYLKKFAIMEERLKMLVETHRGTSLGFGETGTSNAGTGVFGATSNQAVGLFEQQIAAPQTTGIFGSAGDGDTADAAVISLADTNKTDSQNLETLFENGLARVTPTTLSRPEAKVAPRKKSV